LCPLGRGYTACCNYPAILYLNLVATSPAHFTRMAFGFVLLLVMQMVCSAVFPVATPGHWREMTAQHSAGLRFLKFVRYFDGPTNCFPSMHVSVATLTALHASQTLGPWAWLFPVLIAISCVLTRQHYVVDLPFGAALGVLAFAAYARL